MSEDTPWTKIFKRWIATRSIGEVKRLRDAIRAHRDSTEHELCWHHPQLWSLLPEKTDPLPMVPDWPQFMRGCVRYRQSLDRELADAPRTHKEF